MQTLSNKKILLGITGGIAAYKAAELLRLLTRTAIGLRVVTKPSAQDCLQAMT